MTKPRKPPAIKINFTGVASAISGKKRATKTKDPKKVEGSDPLVRMLPCPLTEEERRERAWQETKVGAEIDAEVKRIADAGLAAQRHLRELRDSALQLRQEAVGGFAIRQVQCHEEVDHEHQNVVLIRSDNGNIVEVIRKATAADLNGNLFEGK